MSVTVGLCLYRLRPRYCSGTVSNGPKLTIVESTDGNNLRHTACACRLKPVRTCVQNAAEKLVAPFGRSDVKNPLINPAFMSVSIVLPPVPVAWNTSTSQPCSSRYAFAVLMQGVVTPNIVAAIIGLFSWARGFILHHTDDRIDSVGEYLHGYGVESFCVHD